MCQVEIGSRHAGVLLGAGGRGKFVCPSARQPGLARLAFAPMLAAYAHAIDADDPLSGLEIGDRPDPEAPDGWSVVTVKAAALNHHDLWSLRGQGLRAEQLPMILGCDAAGVDEEGNEVVVHSVISSDD